jgi:hypothetical protein
VPVALDQHQVFVQFNAGASRQKAVYRITGSGQPQAAALHLQTKAFSGVDQAGLLGREDQGVNGFGHGVSPWLRPLLSAFVCASPSHT